MRLLSLLVAFAAVCSFNGVAQAQELDNEAQVTNEQIALAKDIPTTLVVRTNATTGEVQVLHSNEKIAADASTAALVAQADFTKVDASSIVNGELDQDSGKTSWYFCFNNSFSYPAYYYGGYSYNYNYYYNYNYSGWNYSYYRWNYNWWY